MENPNEIQIQSMQIQKLILPSVLYKLQFASPKWDNRENITVTDPSPAEENFPKDEIRQLQAKAAERKQVKYTVYIVLKRVLVRKKIAFNQDHPTRFSFSALG